jgi:hypothetical protein
VIRSSSDCGANCTEKIIPADQATIRHRVVIRAEDGQVFRVVASPMTTGKDMVYAHDHIESADHADRRVMPKGDLSRRRFVVRSPVIRVLFTLDITVPVRYPRPAETEYIGTFLRAELPLARDVRKGVKYDLALLACDRNPLL